MVLFVSRRKQNSYYIIPQLALVVYLFVCLFVLFFVCGFFVGFLFCFLFCFWTVNL